MKTIVAGIDVHKRVLMVVIGVWSEQEEPCWERRRFGTTTSELQHLTAWLGAHGVGQGVMESTAQYWKPVWMALEPHLSLSLAQAWSNRAPRGKKTDFKDAERLVRRYVAGELTMSFVPDAEQRLMRTLARRRVQLVRDRVRTRNQVESLLEETRIKLSSVVTDLFGASGLRILTAIADGETNPLHLVDLADARIQCPPEELADALTGTVSEIHRRLLGQHLTQRLLIEQQMEQVEQMTAKAMKTYADAITRLSRIPGIRVTAAQQIVAEAGASASAFASPAQFSSWIGACPGRQESAEKNRSARCAKGNVYLRRLLSQAAQSAVLTKNSFFQLKFRRLLPRLGYAKAVWAIARHLSVVIWKILHDGVEYRERGLPSTAAAIKRRTQRLKQELRALGYSDELKPLTYQALPA